METARQLVKHPLDILFRLAPGSPHRRVLRSRYKFWLDLIRTSFWFVPGFLVLSGVGLARLSIAVDSIVDFEKLEWWLPTSPSDARVILSAIAGGTVGISGVVFSVTVATLSIAASQFGSRPLRTFLKDFVTQFALGTFIATSLYCLIVLREVRDVERQEYVPQLSVSLGVGLAVLSMAVLVYFIHHIAVSIQASKVVQAIAGDLDGAIEELFPEDLGQEEPDPSKHMAIVTAQLQHLGENSSIVSASKDGYVQMLDAERLMLVATQSDLVLQLACRPGFFVIRDVPIARVWPAERVTDSVVAEVNACLFIGGRRTPHQDLECAIDEMAEVAVRALSPGINDPFTAVACIDRLGAALSRLAARRIPSPYRLDETGRIRFIVAGPTFSDALSGAFGEIREYGRNSISVSVRLLEILQLLATRVMRPGDRDALLREAETIRGNCQATLAASLCGHIVEHFNRVISAIEQRSQFFFVRPGEVGLHHDGRELVARPSTGTGEPSAS